MRSRRISYARFCLLTTRWPALVGLLRHAVVDALAVALDPGAQHVSRAQVDRRLPGLAHPARRSGGEEVPWSQGDRLARIGDDLGRLEQQVRGPRLLHDLAVDLAPDLQVGRVPDLVRRDEVRTGWRGLLEHLAGQPLQGAPLPVPH